MPEGVRSGLWTLKGCRMGSIMHVLRTRIAAGKRLRVMVGIVRQPISKMPAAKTAFLECENLLKDEAMGGENKWITLVQNARDPRVAMPEGKRMDVVGQMILGATPALITELYAFYRIGKFRKGVLVLLATIGLVLFMMGLDYGVDSVFDKSEVSPSGPHFTTGEEILSLIIGMLVPMYFARKWTIEYNEYVETGKI